jgi:hypothetical protein
MNSNLAYAPQSRKMVLARIRSDLEIEVSLVLTRRFNTKASQKIKIKKTEKREENLLVEYTIFMSHTTTQLKYMKSQCLIFIYLQDQLASTGPFPNISLLQSYTNPEKQYH